MRRNPWFKLAGVSLVALILSFLLLWGVGQYNQYRFYNGYGNMNMQYNNGYMPGGINMNGNMSVPMGNMRNNMNNNMYMNGNMNMQGGMNMNIPMGNMNMQGGMNMPMTNMNGSSNMQGSGMGMMGGM